MLSAADGAATVLSSLRNLNAVIASDVASGAVAWVLASDPALNTSYKTYAFAHEQEKFYYPHMVSQLPDGHVLLVDDGNNRPGCARGSESSCYSRAVEYALVDGRVRVDSASGVLVSGDGEAAAKNGTTNASQTYAMTGDSPTSKWNGQSPLTHRPPPATHSSFAAAAAHDVPDGSLPPSHRFGLAKSTANIAAVSHHLNPRLLTVFSRVMYVPPMVSSLTRE